MEPTLRIVVLRADDLFRDDTLVMEPPECRFRLSFEGESRVGAGRQTFRLEPNLDADIELPNLEHRWKVYLRSYSRDSIAERDEDTSGRTTRIGISQFREDLNLEADAGARIRVQPEAYVRLQWDHYWIPGYWVIRPAERLFYETDKGYGEQTSLTAHRWLGRNPTVFIQSLTSAEVSQSSDGVEFEQFFRVGKLREVLEPMGHYKRVSGDRDIARGLVFRAGLFGHSEEVTTVDGYRIGLLDRHPLYKKWIYLSTIPELLWERDRDFKTELRIRISVDMLFWGSIER
jgi:hypothetical protein